MKMRVRTFESIPQGIAIRTAERMFKSCTTHTLFYIWKERTCSIT